MAYPCLHFTDNHEGLKTYTPYPGASIRCIQGVALHVRVVLCVQVVALHIGVSLHVRVVLCVQDALRV
ncbi:hypothetical protein Tco_1340821 [Tanacetum coccineum]